MQHNEFIIADLALRDRACNRPDEQEFDETRGHEPAIRPALHRALAAVAAAVRRLRWHGHGARAERSARRAEPA